MNELMIQFGGEVKSLGGNKIGGQLITFGDALKTDLELDFFDNTTDFDVDFSGSVKSTVYFNHGLDPVLGKKKLGGGVKATLTKNDVGIWVEAILDERNEYEAQLLTLVSQKKLGWSSGTAPYLIEREQVGKAFHIKKWTLGVDASLTPTPAEFRNQAVSIKSVKLQSFKSLMGEEDSMLGNDVIEGITFNSVSYLNDRFLYRGLWEIVYSDLLTKEQKIAKLTDGADELAAKIKLVGTALLELAPDALQSQYGIAKSLYFDSVEEKTFSTLGKHIEYVKSVAINLAERLKLIDKVSGVKKGAQFNATNKEYLKDISEKLVSMGDEISSHGTGIKDLITPSDSEDSEGKSIQAEALKLHSEFLSIIQ